MKKITLVLAFIGMITLNSCTINDEPDQIQQINNTFVSELFEVTTSFGPNNNYSRLVTFNPPIFSTDMVLVYHLYEVDNGTDVWRIMPQTYYFDNGAELDYNFDFTRFDVRIFLDSNFNLDSFSPAWTQNQTFRIVVIPADFTNRMSGAVDYSDYEATIKMLGYENAEIKKIK